MIISKCLVGTLTLYAYVPDGHRNISQAKRGHELTVQAAVVLVGAVAHNCLQTAWEVDARRLRVQSWPQPR